MIALFLAFSLLCPDGRVTPARWWQGLCADATPTVAEPTPEPTQDPSRCVFLIDSYDGENGTAHRNEHRETHNE